MAKVSVLTARERERLFRTGRAGPRAAVSFLTSAERERLFETGAAGIRTPTAAATLAAKTSASIRERFFGPEVPGGMIKSPTSGIVADPSSIAGKRILEELKRAQAAVSQAALTPREFLQAGNIITQAASGDIEGAQASFQQAEPAVRELVRSQTGVSFKGIRKPTVGEIVVAPVTKITKAKEKTELERWQAYETVREPSEFVYTGAPEAWAEAVGAPAAISAGVGAVFGGPPGAVTGAAVGGLFGFTSYGVGFIAERILPEKPHEEPIGFGILTKEQQAVVKKERIRQQKEAAGFLQSFVFSPAIKERLAYKEPTRAEMAHLLGLTVGIGTTMLAAPAVGKLESRLAFKEAAKGMTPKTKALFEKYWKLSKEMEKVELQPRRIDLEKTTEVFKGKTKAAKFVESYVRKEDLKIGGRTSMHSQVTKSVSKKLGRGQDVDIYTPDFFVAEHTKALAAGLKQTGVKNVKTFIRTGKGGLKVGEIRFGSTHAIGIQPISKQAAYAQEVAGLWERPGAAWVKDPTGIQLFRASTEAKRKVIGGFIGGRAKDIAHFEALKPMLLTEKFITRKFVAKKKPVKFSKLKPEKIFGIDITKPLIRTTTKPAYYPAVTPSLKTPYYPTVKVSKPLAYSAFKEPKYKPPSYPSYKPPSYPSYKPPAYPTYKVPTRKPSVYPPYRPPTRKPPAYPPYKPPTMRPSVYPPYRPPTRKPPAYPPYKPPTMRPSVYPPYKPPTMRPPSYPPYRPPTRKPPSYPPYKPPAYPHLQFDFRPRKKKVVRRQAYETLVKKRGKFVKVSKNRLGINSALALGEFVTDQASPRTFRVRKIPGTPTGPTRNRPSLRKFRKPIKDGVSQRNSPLWVEKTAYAIDAKNEFKEITFAGLAALRKGFFRKKKRRRKR